MICHLCIYPSIFIQYAINFNFLAGGLNAVLVAFLKLSDVLRWEDIAHQSKAY
jgi:hypothetical protein